MKTQEDGCSPTDVGCGYVLCYCPGINGCKTGADFTHQAGALRVTESIRGITLNEEYQITSFAMGIHVDCSFPGGFVRCVAKDGPAANWGMYAESSFFATGPTEYDVAWGASLTAAVAGNNEVTLHLTRFLEANQDIHVWCYLTDSPVFVYPPNLDGVTITVPGGMTKPEASYLQQRGWHGGLYMVTVTNLVVQARRLAEKDHLIGGLLEAGPNGYICMCVYIYIYIYI